MVPLWILIWWFFKILMAKRILFPIKVIIQESSPKRLLKRKSLKVNLIQWKSFARINHQKNRLSVRLRKSRRRPPWLMLNPRKLLSITTWNRKAIGMLVAILLKLQQISRPNLDSFWLQRHSNGRPKKTSRKLLRNFSSPKNLLSQFNNCS